MHYPTTALSSLPTNIAPSHPFSQPTPPASIPIPPSIPILNSSPDLCRTANLPSYPRADHILSLMAEPNDSEKHILDTLEQLKEENLRIYQHPYYGSLLEAALRLMRPETLQFLLSKGSPLHGENYLDTLSEEQLADTLRTLGNIWSKHYHSRGRRDFDRPAIGLLVVKKMTQVVASLYKAKAREKAISDLFPENLKAKASYQSFLEEIEGQGSYCFKVEETQ